MFEFINRAASIDDSVVIAGLDQLLPLGDWRDKLLKAQSPGHRKEILLDAFTECLTALGGYKHICETTILRPYRDRPLYSLFYGTRHDTGLEVFRGCQVKALEAQAATRAVTKVDHAEEKTGQSELFESYNEMSGNEAQDFLNAERVKARDLLLALAPDEKSPIQYKDLWPQILARHVVTRPAVNQIAAALRKEGLLVFPGWEPKKRVPQAAYVLHRKT